MRLLLTILLACAGWSAKGQVPFFSDATYTRDEPTNPPWFVHNDGQPSRLFHNGVFQSQETGPNDLNMAAAWQLQPDAEGVMVGVVDVVAAHGNRVQVLPGVIAPGVEIYLVAVNRWYPDVIGAGILECVSNGCRIVVLSNGYAFSDVNLSNACQTALWSNVVIVCAAPNVAESLDTVADYPNEWRFPNVLTVTSTDRTGNLYPMAAWGAGVVSAPGRNIVSAGTYSSGTSYAAPIAAGGVALLAKRFPGQRAAAWLTVLRDTAGTAAQINLASALLAPVPTMTITASGPELHGLPGWSYSIEHSDDLANWLAWAGDFTPGFYRGKVL